MFAQVLELRVIRPDLRAFLVLLVLLRDNLERERRGLLVQWLGVGDEPDVRGSLLL